MSETTVKVHVSELRVGMYISKLDREWLDTPFLMQGFYIETTDDVNTVAEYCEYVWVDVARKAKRPTTASQAAFDGGAIYPPKEDIYAEHSRTSVFFGQARSLTKTLLDDIILGGAINTEAAKETVNECVQSVIRHPDALMWMTRLRNESEYTAEHCLNVCILAIAFGRHLGLSEEKLQQLGLCGLLHDVGKMRVPPQVLNKPARLTLKEMRMMMAHTIHGRNLLLAAGNVYTGAIDVAYSHHERIDGTGYPRKLPGENISLFSRIISIVDAYDAMTADRCYQKARTTTEALKIIYEGRGTQFDDHLALAFLETVGLYPPGSIVELISGVVGVVIETNQQYKHLPVVSVLLDADKKPLDKALTYSLSLIETDGLSKDFLVRRVHADGSFGLSLRDFQEKGLLKYSAS
ncbi:HD-GYP domain-containing protein [Marinagarivorans algicola]|uniref:HD-GYP domain-containing protein n=1 Tax=Marinagarivorans algicola TaxID=1513270 RepID=UPI003734E159